MKKSKATLTFVLSLIALMLVLAAIVYGVYLIGAIIYLNASLSLVETGIVLFTSVWVLSKIFKIRADELSAHWNPKLIQKKIDRLQSYLDEADKNPWK